MNSYIDSVATDTDALIEALKTLADGMKEINSILEQDNG